MLTELVTEEADVHPVDHSPLTAAMQVLDTNRPQVAEIARLSWSAPGDHQARAEAAQWARFASWLYDTFVRNRPALRRLGAQRYSRRMREETGASPFRMEVSQQGRTPHAECRSVSQQPAPPDIARRLMIEPLTVVVCRENRYYADGEPVQNGTTYIPIGVAGTDSHVTTKALGRASLYSRFEELGYDVARVREQVSTRLPTPDESASLKIPPGVPVLEILHTSYDDLGRPFEVTRFTIRADLTVLDYELTVDD
ncbi:GntR family transcriptional regulator [Nucisporomicrobium flavum]|uniref:GntR family transcriptional regulator n=1 Tax=Nucisporomicrobium flavum TaxID=2785915 RepID=UPI0018F41827|nr:UTRA domain-containing protein [Nucisporomicrobium flavum]